MTQTLGQPCWFSPKIGSDLAALCCTRTEFVEGLSSRYHSSTLIFLSLSNCNILHFEKWGMYEGSSNITHEVNIRVNSFILNLIIDSNITKLGLSGTQAIQGNPIQSSATQCNPTQPRATKLDPFSALNARKIWDILNPPLCPYIKVKLSIRKCKKLKNNYVL